MSDDNIRRVWTDDELDSALDALRSDVRTEEPVLAAARAALISTIEQGEAHLTTTPQHRPPRSKRAAIHQALTRISGLEVTEQQANLPG